MKIKKRLQSEGNKIYKRIKKQYTYIITLSAMKIKKILQSEGNKIWKRMKNNTLILSQERIIKYP